MPGVAIVAFYVTGTVRGTVCITLVCGVLVGVVVSRTMLMMCRFGDGLMEPLHKMGVGDVSFDVFTSRRHVVGIIASQLESGLEVVLQPRLNCTRQQLLNF